TRRTASPHKSLPLRDALPISPAGADPSLHAPDPDRSDQASLRGLSGQGPRVAGAERLGRLVAPAPGVRSASAGHGSFLPHQKVLDRKSTRLNSSHVKISYAVF